MGRKELVQSRANAYKARIEAEKASRRRLAQKLSAETPIISLGADASRAFQDFHATGMTELVRGEIKKLVGDMLAQCKITPKNIKERESARQLWDVYLNPLYNLLGSFVAKNKKGEKDAIFWNAFAEELDSQLAKVYAEAGIPGSLLQHSQAVMKNLLNS